MGCILSQPRNIHQQPKIPDDIQYPSYCHPMCQVQDPNQLKFLSVKNIPYGVYTTAEQDAEYLIDYTAKYYLNDVAYIITSPI